MTSYVLARRLRLLPLCLFACFCVACGGDDQAGDSGGETTDPGGDDADSSPSDDDSDTNAADDDDGDDGSFIPEEGIDTGMEAGDPGMLGELCEGPGDCAEDLVCNGIPGVASICSECASDSDCDGGNCTFNGIFFGCGDGSLGQMCETDEACGSELFCADVIDLGGFLNGSFCSECKVDEDCTGGQLCAPMIDFGGFPSITGSRNCIDPGTAPQDSLCDADGSGDEQCEGLCTTGSFMGVFEIGLCGECEVDGDCLSGTCMPAVVSAEGFSGSLCG